jgi:kumamolisin
MMKNVLKGSERQPLPGARAVGKADAAERLEITVLLRSTGGAALKERAQRSAARSGERLSRAEFKRDFGASGPDVASVKKFAAEHGLAVVQEDAGRRTVILSGTVGQFAAAFDVDLQTFKHSGGSYRRRVGAIHVPADLAGIVEAVLGLDDRPVARPHFRARTPAGNVRWRATTGNASFTPVELATLYDFPDGDGDGQCVGIIELGGGERGADLQAYFSDLGLGVGPEVTVVKVDHGRNHPTGDPNGPDGEVMLDCEVVGAIAPKAHIVVYFAPNTDSGFLDSITTAIHDSTNNPSIISISWAGRSRLGRNSPSTPSTRPSRPPLQWESRSASRRVIAGAATG